MNNTTKLIHQKTIKDSNVQVQDKNVYSPPINVLLSRKNNHT